MNSFLIIILILIALDWALGTLSDVLNMRRDRSTVPEEFRATYPQERYEKAARYLRDNTRFGLLQSTFSTLLLVAFILLGGFAWAQHVAAQSTAHLILAGLVFTGIIILLGQILSLPFEMWHTFVIEERYGFNKTTPKTFIADRLKGLVLGVLIGAPLLAAIIWFFAHAGAWAWLICWGVVTVVQLVLAYVAPAWILPLFNKFTPLEEGEVRTAIETYARKEGVMLSGLFKIDGSRRSTKSNAYFTGLGKQKRIALYDTLMEKHSTEELVAVLAHEVGHNKLGHIRRGLVLGILSTGLMFYLLNLILFTPGLYAAFGISTAENAQLPIYAGLVFFGFLYTPISLIISLISSYFSRRWEFQADAFAARTTEHPEHLISALSQLSSENLSDLDPHPLTVALSYSHPPVLQRLRQLAAS